MNEQLDTLPWYKQFWPWFILSIPLATIVAGIITLWIAVSNDVGLVTDDYYRKGIAINERIKQDQASQAANLSANVLFSENPLQVSVFLKGNIPENPQALTLTLSAPIDPEKDKVLELVTENLKLFRAELDELPKGRFYLVLEPKDRSWRLKKEIVLPSSSPIQI